LAKNNILNLQSNNHTMETKEFARATIFNLSETIKYSEGAVVSRTVTKRAEGTVTLFAFDKDQGLSEHTTPFDAQVHIIDGTATVYIDKKPFVLGKDDFIVMPADVPHALEATERFKMILTMIKSK
jgi:quercetin dioxygenase-like cupin family protein